MNLKIIYNDFMNYKFINHYLLFLIFHKYYFIFEPALVIPTTLNMSQFGLSDPKDNVLEEIEWTAYRIANGNEAPRRLNEA